MEKKTIQECMKMIQEHKKLFDDGTKLLLQQEKALTTAIEKLTHARKIIKQYKTLLNKRKNIVGKEEKLLENRLHSIAKEERLKSETEANIFVTLKITSLFYHIFNAIKVTDSPRNQIFQACAMLSEFDTYTNYDKKTAFSWFLDERNLREAFIEIAEHETNPLLQTYVD